MKKLIIIFLLTPSLFFSQTKDELDLCMAIQANSFTSNTEAENALDRILDVIGASKNFVLTPCDKISNAVATAYKGTRYILYDREFMNLISMNTNDWSNLFIFAHEVGHHINGHSIDLLLYTNDVVDAPSLEKSRKQELEADEFAAFVLAKLGANLSQLNNVITLISDNSDDSYSTHPKRDKRLSSVKVGFNKGYTKKSDRTVYVDSGDKKVFFDSNSKIKEYESSKGYVQYGKWFRKYERDIFEGSKWEAVTSGSIRGNNDFFEKAPILKISKEEKLSSYKILLEFDDLLSDVFPGLDTVNDKKWYVVRATFLILDSNENQLLKIERKFFVHSKSVLAVNFGSNIYEKNWISSMKLGKRLLIKIDNYSKYVDKLSITKEIDNEYRNRIIELEEDFKIADRWYYKDNLIGVFKRQDGMIIAKSEVEKLDRDQNNLKKKYGLNSMASIKSKTRDLRDEIYSKRNTRIRNKINSLSEGDEIKGVYFEFSLTGSSKALAD